MAQEIKETNVCLTCSLLTNMVVVVEISKEDIISHITNNINHIILTGGIKTEETA